MTLSDAAVTTSSSVPVSTTLSYTTSKSHTSSSATPAAVTSAPSKAPSKSSGLSTGAKAGIGAGIPIGIIAVGGLLFMAWRKGRHLKAPQGRTQDMQEVDGSAVATDSPDYEIKELYVPPPVVHELPTGTGPNWPSGPPANSGYPTTLPEQHFTNSSGTRP
jgi:hypothetical protein